MEAGRPARLPGPPRPVTLASAWVRPSGAQAPPRKMPAKARSPTPRPNRRAPGRGQRPMSPLPDLRGEGQRCVRQPHTYYWRCTRQQPRAVGGANGHVGANPSPPSLRPPFARLSSHTSPPGRRPGSGRSMTGYWRTSRGCCGRGPRSATCKPATCTPGRSPGIWARRRRWWRTRGGWPRPSAPTAYVR